jgi:hypothetical protein
MNTTLLKTQVLASLLAGTTRQPITAVTGENAALNALSLTGQALRFERPAAPAQFAVEPAIADTRTVLPDNLRRPLLRLVTGKLATEHMPLALAHAFDRLRLRPHPFDLPRMDNFVRTYAEQLGATAQFWARPKDEAAQPIGYFDDETLTDANWTQATLGRRADYIEGRRAQDKAAARGLVEAVWPQENADVRFRLLQALETTLDATDKPFLDTLDKDRAPRVRALAHRLLVRLGAGTGENPALKDLLTRIKRSETGFLRKRAVLALELPANVKDQAAPMWIRGAFADIGLHELASALALSETDLIDASAKNGNLMLGLALMATSDRRLDLFAQIVDGLPEAWALLEQTGLRDLEPMSAAERLRWAAILVAPYGRKLPAVYLLWSWLHRALRQPAPPQMFETLLSANFLEGLADLDKQGSAWMELMAAMCPAPQRERLRVGLSAFESAITASAMPLLDILNAMEAVMEKARPNA